MFVAQPPHEQSVKHAAGCGQSQAEWPVRARFSILLRLAGLVVGFGLLAGSHASLAWAQNGGVASPGSSTDAGKTKGNKFKDGVPVLTPAREAAALTFCERHHPELTELLRQLKSMNRDQYAHAIHDLFRASERLARVQERSPDQYELELQVWKIDSRIRLLAARMTMSSNSALEQELEAALKERVSIRLELAKSERKRLSARAAELDRLTATLEKGRDSIAKSELNQIKKQVAEMNTTGAGGTSGTGDPDPNPSTTAAANATASPDAKSARPSKNPTTNSAAKKKVR